MPNSAGATEASAGSVNGEFYRDLVSGLRQVPKQLSPKYFYDAQGSRYFDQICQLDEYYPYRTELALLPRVADELRGYWEGRAPRGLQVVEFGAGSLHKIKPLLDRLAAIEHYTAIDISGDHLQRACDVLARHFPNLSIQAVEADFTQRLAFDLGSATPVGFFPGSTIGNFTPQEAVSFLRSARQTLGAGSYMLLGVDTKKDEALLNRAYNDASGLTARFNKNLLARCNRELGTDFDLDRFEHWAWYNSERGRIEMHLRSKVVQSVRVGEERFRFRAGETLHTENSYKYYPEEFEHLAQDAGWRTERWWLAEKELFAVTLLWNP